MTKILSRSLTIPALAILMSSFVSPAVHAQTAEDATKASAKHVAAINANNVGLGLIALRISRSSGVAVVAESTLMTRQITLATAGGTLDSVLANLSSALPKGTVLRATFAPEADAALAGDAATTVDGDSVATLLRAQDAFAPKTKTTDGVAVSNFVPGQFEFMGRKVTMAEAAPQIVALHLRPVYVLMTSRPAIDPVAKLAAMQTEQMRQWANLSPDQRKQAMENQFSAMMNMDSADRVAMLGQMMDQGKYMMQQMQSMPPEQQKQFMAEVMQTAQSSGMLPKDGPGGTPGAPKQ